MEINYTDFKRSLFSFDITKFHLSSLVLYIKNGAAFSAFMKQSQYTLLFSKLFLILNSSFCCCTTFHMHNINSRQKGLYAALHKNLHNPKIWRNDGMTGPCDTWFLSRANFEGEVQQSRNLNLYADNGSLLVSPAVNCAEVSYGTYYT